MKIKSSILRCALCLACALGASLPAGCKTIRPSGGVDSIGVTAKTKADLLLSLEGFHEYFSGTVQGAAFRITSSTEDAGIRRQALRWKMGAIAACRHAIFLTDPLPALVDTATLCVQMEQFLTEGQGKESFGEHQEIAVQASQRLVAEIERILRDYIPSDRSDEVLQEIHKYAASHPIIGGGRQQNRPSFREETGFASLSWVIDLPMSPFKMFQGVDQGAQAIAGFSLVAHQFGKIVEGLPQQLYWNMESLLLDLEENPAMAGLLKSIDDVGKSSARFAATAEKLPVQIREELKTFLDTFEGQQEQFQKTLEEARKTSQEIDGLLASAKTFNESLQSTTKNFNEAGRSWKEALEAFQDVLEELLPSKEKPEPAAQKPEPAEGKEPEKKGRPYDILDYALTAEKVTRTAAELRSLFQEFRETKKVAEESLGRAGASARELANYITGCAIAVVLAVFLAAVAYRLLARRLQKTR